MAETMKGYVFKDVNDLRLEDRPIPTIQDPRDAIVKVALSSICASDFHIKVGAVPSANKDIILGHEFAGDEGPCLAVLEALPEAELYALVLSGGSLLLLGGEV